MIRKQNMFISVAQFAKQYKINYRTVLREITRGNLKAIKIGRIYKINDETRRSYLKASNRIRPLIISVAVVIYQENVLVVRRRKAEGRLEWQFPAGTLKYKERSSKRAEIECREECGIKCKAEKCIARRIHPDTYTKIIYWLCRYISGEVINSDKKENSEVKWVEKQKALKMITSDVHPKIRKLLHK